MPIWSATGRSRSANLSAKQNAGIDLLAELPGAQAWYDAVAAREPSVQQALADQAAARKARGG